jgi:hypothetical protein
LNPNPPAGIKFDVDKDRWDLLPLGPIREIVRVLTHGARKYAPMNWQHVGDFEDRYYAALMRHLYAWRTGEAIDPESGFHHLSHAACNIIFLLWRSLATEEPTRKDTNVEEREGE